MFPITKTTLSFREIADYWSREMHPSASWKEVFHTLESAWWLGELRGHCVHSRLQLLKEMFTRMLHPGIVFIVGDGEGPPPVELPDGIPQEVDLRPQIRVPSSNTESWDEAACSKAFHALAETSSIESYPELAVGLTLIKLSYEEFNNWVRSSGYSMPTFWQPPDQAHRHHTGAASSTSSDDHAPHLGRWRAKPGEQLTMSEI